MVCSAYSGDNTLISRGDIASVHSSPRTPSTLLKIAAIRLPSMRSCCAPPVNTVGPTWSSRDEKEDGDGVEASAFPAVTVIDDAGGGCSNDEDENVDVSSLAAAAAWAITLAWLSFIPL